MGYGRPPRLAVLAVAVPVGLAMAGCASDPRTPAARTSAPVTAAPATATPGPPASLPSPQQAALAAYQGMWRDYVSAAATSDWQSPALGRHASGAALSVLVRGLDEARQRGIVTRGTPAFAPHVTQYLRPPARPAQAMISDCLDDTRWLDYTASGHLADTVPGGHRFVQALVTQSGRTWKVTQLVIGQEGTCA